MGVTMFFVLSGFLITWLLLREHSLSGRIALRDFYIRRMLRIWPAYFALIGVSVLLRHYLNPQEPWRPLGPPLLTSLTFTYNYFKAAGGMTHLAIDQLWTVSVEEQFYFVWPAVLILLLRRGREWAVMAVSSAVVLALVWRCVLYLGFGVSWRYIYTAFDTRADALAMGCLLALVSATPAFLRLARTTIRTPLMPLLPLGILVVNNDIPGSYHWTIGPTVEAACMLVLIVQLLQLFRSRLWSWLEHPTTKYVGIVSYSAYLYHYLGLAVAADLRQGAGVRGHFVLGTTTTLALASTSYYLIERPFLRLRRWFTPPRGNGVEGLSASRPCASVGRPSLTPYQPPPAGADSGMPMIGRMLRAPKPIAASMGKSFVEWLEKQDASRPGASDKRDDAQ